MKESINTLVSSFNNPPVLFIGSGFGQRYYGLPTWDKLLLYFCEGLNSYSYYHSKSDGDLPTTASFIAEDFFEFWWRSPQYEDERKKFGHLATNKQTPLKIAISQYLKLRAQEVSSLTREIQNELDIFKSIPASCVVTTNYDENLERIFDEYKVFVGQKTMLTSEIYNIGELFKIHGCVTNPNSMVLSKEDYDDFDKANPYLAAKLITLFIEYPIVFLGYSVSDPNIIKLLDSISEGVGNEFLQRLKDRLIFVSRSTVTRPAGISHSSIKLNSGLLNYTHLVLDDFLPLFSRLTELKPRLPAKIFRQCKEHLYEMTRGNDTKSTISVIDIDDLDSADKVEFVIGVGITDRLSRTGYSIIAKEDIFSDILLDDKCLDADKLLTETIPFHLKGTIFIPVYKYLRKLGITTNDTYKTSKYFGLKNIPIQCVKFRYKQYNYEKTLLTVNTVKDVVSTYERDTAIFVLPWLKWQEIDRADLREYLIDNCHLLNDKNYRYGTGLRKLICMLDFLENGF